MNLHPIPPQSTVTTVAMTMKSVKLSYDALSDPSQQNTSGLHQMNPPTATLTPHDAGSGPISPGQNQPGKNTTSRTAKRAAPTLSDQRKQSHPPSPKNKLTKQEQQSSEPLSASHTKCVVVLVVLTPERDE